LDVTGKDVAAFCDELLRAARTYTEDWREKLNREIAAKFGKGGDSK
jgi:DNA-binding ferritin-like protein (Dps family)